MAQDPSSAFSSTATLVESYLTSSPFPLSSIESTKHNNPRGRWLKRFTHLPSPSATEDCRSVIDEPDLFPPGCLSVIAASATLDSAAGLMTHLLKVRNENSYEATYGLLYRATLPTETIALGILILAKLSPELYHQYAQEALFTLGRERHEVINLVCLVLAQKILHDAPYTTATWSDIVAEKSLSRSDINLVERLVLRNLDYQFKELVTPRNLAAVVSVIRAGRGSNLSWQDVKIAILRSSQRGKTSQEASPAMTQGGVRPRLEKSGRRALWRQHEGGIPVQAMLALSPHHGPAARLGRVPDLFPDDSPFLGHEGEGTDEEDWPLASPTQTWLMDRMAHTYPVSSV